MSSLKITLRKSTIGYEKSQRLTARALGLGKVGSSVIQSDTAPIRGMIKKLVHVLSVETVDAEPVRSGRQHRPTAGTDTE